MAKKPNSMRETMLIAVTKAIPAFKGTGRRGDNEAGTLHEIFVWQELADYADKQHKDAWKRAQQKGGVIESDDDMRSNGEGEHIITEAGNYSLVASVTAPRRNFSLEQYVLLLKKKYKISVADLMELAEKARVPGRSQLTKRVLEA